MEKPGRNYKDDNSDAIFHYMERVRNEVLHAVTTRPRGPYRPRTKQADAEAPPQGERLTARERAIRDAERVLQAAKRARKIMAARDATVDGFRAFIELCMPDPEAPDDVERSLFQCEPHHRILMEMVVSVATKKTMRAGCSMPPQHGKSLILSRFGLAWILGLEPHLRVLFATYSDGLAQTRGDEVREVLQSPIFKAVFPKAVLKAGSQSKTEMRLTAGGSINFVGRGTATTGRPADMFFIDDPYKDEEEGSSETIRQAVKDWYSAVVFSRCHVLTPVLIVHTRWNEDDLLGWLTDPEHPENRARPDRVKRWRYVNLPTPVDDSRLAKALGVEVGSPLWPSRFPLHHLKEAEDNDPRIYAALYRGRPAPEDGDFFRAEHFQTYTPDELPKNLRIYAASDHAVSEKQRADYSCLVLGGVCKDDILWVLPDLFWEQARVANTDKVVDAMIDRMAQYAPMWWRAASDHISKAVGPFLRKRMLERRVFCNIVESSEAGDKMRKAQAVQARMAMGRVRFPAGAPWLMRAKSEMLKFPHGKHDDFVDALAHLGRGLRTMFSAARDVAPANENAMPPTGTLGWIKKAARLDSERNAVRQRLRVM
jgi:predicted phage terminase large subunit-like protein